MNSTGIILLLSVTLAAGAQIEGLWQVNKSNDLVEIRSTSNGLKAKFVTSQEWDFYDYLNRDTYEDRRGNRYYLKSSEKLIWESRDGRRKINLRKADRRYRDQHYSNRYDDDYGNYRQGRNNNRYDYDNDYGYVDDYCSDSCSSSCTRHNKGKYRKGNRTFNNHLSGTWVNRWRNTIAHVEFDGNVVRMKTNKSRRWITYRRTHHKKLFFEDKWGNRLKFKNNGDLDWKRSDGRRDIQFHKDDRYRDR